MAQSPGQLGVNLQIKVRIGIIHYFLHLELIEAHQPIGLVKAVFTHQRGLFQCRQALIVGIDGNIARIVDTPHRRSLIEGRRKIQNILVRLGGSAYYHLCALSCRSETRSVAVFLAFFRTFKDSLLDVAHRRIYTLMVFLRGKQFQVLLLRYLDIDAETVGIKPCLIHQFAAGTGNALQMDISVETMDSAEVLGNAHQAFHRVIGITHHPTAQEKPFDIVAAIELHGEVYKLGHRQRGTRQVVAAAVDAVGAVVDAIIGKHHFEQGDTTAVLGKTMADAPATHSVPQHACLAGAHRTTGGARDVILCRLCQYLQFIENVFIHNTCVKSSNNTFQKQKRPPVVAVFRSIKYAFFLTS